MMWFQLLLEAANRSWTLGNRGLGALDSRQPSAVTRVALASRWHVWYTQSQSERRRRRRRDAMPALGLIEHLFRHLQLQLAIAI